MKIASISQPTLDQILKQEFDIVVCASGYERRSACLATTLYKLDSKLISIGHMEKQEVASRPENDRKYARLGFVKHEMSGDSFSAARQFLSSEISNLKSESCRLLIDISSMTRAWYGGFIHALWSQINIESIVLDFVYIPPAFKNPTSIYPPNEIVGPLEGFSGLTTADRPTSLIIGLGEDRNRAIGIKEELDPYDTYVFYADPAADKRYTQAVKTANYDILHRLEKSKIFEYPIHDVVTTFNMLGSLCRGLIMDHRVVISSFGPKTFSLCSLLLATNYPEISVWRITAGTKDNVVDRNPSRQRIVLEVEWSRNDA